MIQVLYTELVSCGNSQMCQSAEPLTVPAKKWDAQVATTTGHYQRQQQLLKDPSLMTAAAAAAHILHVS